MSNALDLIGQPALAIDRFGLVIDMNASAECVFDDTVYVKCRRLVVTDAVAKSEMEALKIRLRTTPDTEPLPANPILVRRGTRGPLVIRTMPVHGAARSPFLGARAILLLSDLHKPASGAEPVMLSKLFELTPAEARLASLLHTGISLERIAEELGVTQSTARNQLKAVFAKTDTSRQGELIALLSRL